MKRRLAAILAIDIVGYSRLMRNNEEGTLADLIAVRRLLDRQAANHNGRTFGVAGDSVLAEFSSPVEAVRCTVNIQNEIAQTNADRPEGEKMQLRIGVNLGDVMDENGTLYGDGINVAARLESLCDAGGMCISGTIYEHVRDRIEISFRDDGEHQVKNIDRPIRVWHWNNATPSPAQQPVEVAPLSPSAPPVDPDLKLPDRPSVAVLPFDNMSGDPEQDFFADGMTEDLITDLSKVSGLFVVARNSTFAFKGQALDIPTIARRLGVGNVIEGSVRKMGERVRINVQLIDAATGGHIWADRYDGNLSSVFELQDDVCSKVVSALSVRLTQSEARRLNDVHTTNLDAYELFVQAKSTPYPPIPGRLAAARELFEKVVEIDPDFAGGYTGLSWIIGFGALWGYEDPFVLGSRAEALAYKAISVDASFGWSYTVLGMAFLAQRRFSEAVEAAQKGIDLLPNDADAQLLYAVINTMRGNGAEALKAADQAIRLSPNFINGPYLNVKSLSLFMAGNYEEAIIAHEQNIARGGPVGPPALCWAAASYQAVGQIEDAKKVLDEMALRFPQFGLKGWNLLALVENDSLRAKTETLFRAAGMVD